MYLHYGAKLIYLAHPKTGSMATASALCRAGWEKFSERGLASDHHMPLWAEGSPVTPEDREDWTVVTTVRNHWDAAVSWAFRRYPYKPAPWDHKAIEFALGPSNRWIKEDRFWWLHADEADVILRYETLEDDLAAFCALMGVDAPDLQPVNVTEHRAGRHYRECLTAEAALYIEERFAREIERFEYAF